MHVQNIFTEIVIKTIPHNVYMHACYVRACVLIICDQKHCILQLTIVRVMFCLWYMYTKVAIVATSLDNYF